MTNTPDATKIAEAFAKQDAELNKIVIMPELKEFLDLLSDTERKGLEADIIRDGGASEPLDIWKEKNVLIDGHNRYEICTAHNLPFKTVERSFKDIEAVKEWMLGKQLHRRNLTPDRITYFTGMLYNLHKQDPTKVRVATTDGVSTAQKIANDLGVSEKTVRRAGDIAKGIDAVGRVQEITGVKAKLDAIRGKNASMPAFKKEELEEIGKVSDPKIAEEAVKELTAIKTVQKAAQVKAQTQAKTVQKAVQKTDPYGVIFSKPDFGGIGYSASTQVKPPMAENAVVYMVVPDEELIDALELFKRWGLTYEASLVFATKDGYEGPFSDIRHTFLLVGTKGIVTTPKKASGSVIPCDGEVEGAMIKLIEGYHDKAKRLDMRDKRTAAGWDTLKKAA